jgi:hypothetical protein
LEENAKHRLALEALGVGYVLKAPDHAWVRSRPSAYRN